mmetsp:Transcript_17706/g.41056  ORF Transcript_17706/g.41056 Transcript_17706/m.41056 type:complete len:241 (+) Transcript_17706:620-1342(+)
MQAVLHKAGRPVLVLLHKAGTLCQLGTMDMMHNRSHKRLGHSPRCQCNRVGKGQPRWHSPRPPLTAAGLRSWVHARHQQRLLVSKLHRPLRLGLQPLGFCNAQGSAVLALAPAPCHWMHCSRLQPQQPLAEPHPSAMRPLRKVPGCHAAISPPSSLPPLPRNPWYHHLLLIRSAAVEQAPSVQLLPCWVSWCAPYAGWSFCCSWSLSASADFAWANQRRIMTCPSDPQVPPSCLVQRKCR